MQVVHDLEEAVQMKPLSHPADWLTVKTSDLQPLTRPAFENAMLQAGGMQQCRQDRTGWITALILLAVRP